MFWSPSLNIYLVYFKQVPAAYSCWCKQDRLDYNCIGLQNINAYHDCSNSHAKDGSPWRYVIRFFGLCHIKILSLHFVHVWIKVYKLKWMNFNLVNWVCKSNFSFTSFSNWVSVSNRIQLKIKQSFFCFTFWVDF